MFPRSSLKPRCLHRTTPSGSTIDRSIRGTSHRTRALLTRSVAYGEADLVVGLFTENLGHVSAICHRARTARQSRDLLLEPIHTLRVVLRERGAKGLMTLTASTVDRPRTRLIGELPRMDAAGAALRWVRQAAPPRTAETALWQAISSLLDALDSEELDQHPRVLLAESAFRILEALGYALELRRCVSCGRPCLGGQSAFIDPVRGGLVCRACGGGSRLLSGPLRDRLVKMSEGGPNSLDEEGAIVALELAELALLAHANVGR